MLRYIALAAVAIVATQAATSNLAPIFASWSYTNPGSTTSNQVLPAGDTTFYGLYNGSIVSINSTTGAPLWMGKPANGDRVIGWNYTSTLLVYITGSSYGALWTSNGTQAWSHTRSSMTGFITIVNPMWAYMFSSDKILKVNLANGATTEVKGKTAPSVAPLFVTGGIFVQGSSIIYFANTTGSKPAVQWSKSGVSLAAVAPLWWNGKIIAAGSRHIYYITTGGQSTSMKLESSTGVEATMIDVNGTRSVLVVQQGSYRITSVDMDTKKQITSSVQDNYVRLYGFINNFLVMATDSSGKIRLIKYNYLTGKWVANSTCPGLYRPASALISGDLVVGVAKYNTFVLTASQWEVNRNFATTAGTSAFDAAKQRVYVANGDYLHAIDFNSVTAPAYRYKSANSIASTGLLEYNGAMYFATSDNGEVHNLIGLSMTNGSVVSNIKLPKRPSSAQPWMFNGRIIVNRESDSPGSIGFMHVDLATKKAEFVELKECYDRATWAVDEEGKAMYGSCTKKFLVRVDEEFKAEYSAATDSTVSYNRVPTIGEKFVYATMNSGRVTAFPKLAAAFKAASAWTTKDPISDRTSVTFSNDYIYGTNMMTLQAAGGKSGAHYWTLNRINSANFYQPVDAVGERLVNVDDESNVWIMEPGFTVTKDGKSPKLLPSLGRVFKQNKPTSWMTTPTQTLIVSKSDTISGINVATNSWMWNTTETGCIGFRFDRGLLYTSCGSKFSVFGADNGQKLLQASSSFAPSAYFIKNSTVYFVQDDVVSEFQLNAAGIDVPLPTPPPANAPGSGKKKSSSKLWIVGVVAAVVVIAVVILVLKKVCGGKSEKGDGEYVPMTNSQDNSAV